MKWMGVERGGEEWRGVEWSGVEWSGGGVEWGGVEWSGVERKEEDSRGVWGGGVEVVLFLSLQIQFSL